MAKKNSYLGKITLTVSFLGEVGYSDYFRRVPLTVTVKNDSDEAVSVTLKVESNGVFLPYEDTVEVPFESAVSTENAILSPYYLAECDEVATSVSTVSAYVLGELVASETINTTVLPFDYWAGLSGNLESLVSFIRPKQKEVGKILADVGDRLKKWKVSSELLGYTGTDKNAVRSVLAGVFASLRACEVEREEEDILSPLLATKVNLTRDGKATPLQMAVLTSACLENTRLHPVLAVGKKGVAVGVWLYDTCFLDTVTDDAEIVGKYISDGINNLAFFDVEDLFSSKNVAFAPSSTHFQSKLKEGYYEYFIDVARCRMGGVASLPLRDKTIKGYELLTGEDMSDEFAPAPLPVMKKIDLATKQSRNKQWERRLLDLSGKNPLLNFTGKNAVHLVFSDGDALFSAFDEDKELRLKGGSEEDIPFGMAETMASKKDLLALELKKGLLRTAHSDKESLDLGTRLIRKNKEAEEESGASIMYLAGPFLKYTLKGETETKYAPVVLLPVKLKKAKGNDGISAVCTEKEYFVNNTLLEFLKQEFNIDVRGLGEDVSALKISEISAMVRAETANMKGWEVIEDRYLANFSFSGYLMWNDLRRNFAEFKKNELVSALVEHRPTEQMVTANEEDDGSPSETLTPLPADSSQYAAVSLSKAGASFVLHGPPGTGKSQTITNIIANALHDGRRVLFVAEKKAALDVVKKRLDGIGVGEFCLELHSNKSDKADVIKRLSSTLALTSVEEENGYSMTAEEILSLRETLRAPIVALHKKRKLGVSVYQAILAYLQNKNAPDVMDIESAFYDSLTEKKLSECREMISSASACAKECGGVSNTPFENVNLSEYSVELRDTLYCSLESMMVEIRNLKGYLALFLEFYRQKVSTVTARKLQSLVRIADSLQSGKLDKYFTGVSEEEFGVFYNANRRLDELLGYYFRNFKTLVEVDKDLDELCAYLERGGDFRLDKVAFSYAKKLVRAAGIKLDDEDVIKFLGTIAEIAKCVRIVFDSPLSVSFRGKWGTLNHKKRAEFTVDLTALHTECAKVFMDFNVESFNGMCVRGAKGSTQAVLSGYLRATKSFFEAQEYFLNVIKADRTKLRDEDVLEYYTTKASALLDNIDMLPNWCNYKATAEKMAKVGLTFITDALESGRLKSENILSGFEKNLYKNFLEINISSDPYLSSMTVGTLEDTIEKFRLANEEFSRLSKDRIRAELIERLPSPDSEDGLALEVSAFTRLTKSNLRGVGIRGLFAEVPELMKRIAPCMLMSPMTVAQYLQPVANDFDLVIFDEASQMNTAEAIGAIARAKSAIVVGDPKQLPPTAFFRSAYVDEDNLENEDLESVLDDCLALGMPERHLLWHYRSKHESLIAFSNVMYYDNRLCTFPSPDGLESKVKFVPVDGTYDRGFTKCNKKETEALVGEVVRRLQDTTLSRASMGIVTFSEAQKEDIERALGKAITANKLESVAYDREEPLFVKNLENVQGDERDVILFSVCYGPDKTGRVSLNFGPLNQAGGWRRLNVAVSRAREEMMIFSTMTSAMIDLSKTSSKGVAGLKAFLEFAERGRTTLAVKSSDIRKGAGIGKYIASELSACGFECRYDVGASDFKIDVAVIDPNNKHKFILGILTDGTNAFSVKDRCVLQMQTLKRGNWNVMRVYSVNFYHNPKREIKRIKETLDRLTGADKKQGAWLTKYKKAYRFVKSSQVEASAFITSGDNDDMISTRLKEIVSVEEPISREFLKKRALQTFGVLKSGSKVDGKLDALIDGCAFKKDVVLGREYFYKTEKSIVWDRFRIETGDALRKTEDDFTPYEMVAFIRGALEDRVALYMDELMILICNILHVMRPGEKFISFVRDCVSLGEEKGIFVRSVSDRLSLA